jgi:hypothetical protein
MGIIHYIPMKSLLDCRFTPFWTTSFPCGILGGASHWINGLYPQLYIYIHLYMGWNMGYMWNYKPRIRSVECTSK